MLNIQGQIDPTLDLFEEIERLKKERNAVIMAHYYQEPDIQDIVDVLGDSLLLAREAQKTDADVIVLCGVHFMACLLYTSPSPRDMRRSRMPSSA